MGEVKEFMDELQNHHRTVSEDWPGFDAFTYLYFGDGGSVIFLWDYGHVTWPLWASVFPSVKCDDKTHSPVCCRSYGIKNRQLPDGPGIGGSPSSYLCTSLLVLLSFLPAPTTLFPDQIQLSRQDFRAKMHGVYGRYDARPPLTDTTLSPALPWSLAQVSTGWGVKPVTR